ncbi:MAG: diguanylate cyclase [Nitrospinae bacterium]|nr:diguanylate cyclase [Nitrospinota bacterium]
MKVLVVDDEPTTLLMISQYIKVMGHEVITAVNGEKAVEAFQKDTPDLVLMDVMMPVMNGFETAKRIRKICETVGWIPVIFLTGMNSDEDLAQGIEAGGDDYITKPVSQMVLTAKVRAMERIASMRKQLIKANEELERLSIIDGLTNISNRRRFDEMFEMEWQRATREKTPLSVILMDIDFFKYYNDNYGHLEGDNCLIKVAASLKESLHRATDMVARYGGEEFVALLPNTPMEKASAIAETFRSNIESLNIPHEHSKAASHVSISLGVATTIPEIGGDRKGFLEKADGALYQAKEGGRNRFHAVNA